MNRLSLAWTLLRREWRGGELSLLAASLAFACLFAASVGLFTDRLQRATLQQSVELLGADLVVESTQPADDLHQRALAQFPVQGATTVAFGSMVQNPAGDFLLAGVKAVSADYPLRGHLEIADEPFADSRVADGIPAPGSAWLEPRALASLNLAVGDALTVGATTLTVTQVLTFETDRTGAMYTANPRVLINAADLAATEVLQLGSRATYRYTFAGDDATIVALQDWLEPQLAPQQTLRGLDDASPTVSNALDRTQQFLHLGTVLGMLLAGIAIALAAQRFARRHLRTVALLRALALTRRQVTTVIALQLLLLGLIAAIIGLAAGALGQWLLLELLAGLLPAQLPPPGVMPLVYSLLCGLLLLAGFALPPLVQLGKQPPGAVLRSGNRFTVPWPWYGLAVLSQVAITWLLLGDWVLSALVLGGGALALTLLWGLVRALLWGLRRLAQSRLSLRLALRRLERHQVTTFTQVIAFGLAAMAVGLLYTVRTELLGDWRDQLPADAPNQFVLNLFPEERPDLMAFFERHNLQHEPLYPISPGRLVAINDTPVRDLVSKEDPASRTLDRDLALTWADQLAEDNDLLQGAWWPALQQQQPEYQGHWVSVESELAERLDLEVGDDLTFNISSELVDARVGSIRQVDWESFAPNFYMIFSPGTLDDLPAVYLTSFHLPEDQRALLNAFVREFPTATLLDVAQLLERVQRIIDQLSLGVQAVFGLIVAAGLFVLVAGILATRDERLVEGALLRTLGASRAQVSGAQRYEFFSIGLLAGIFAAVGLIATNSQLYRRLFDSNYWPDPLVIALVILATTVGIGLAGAWGTRAVVRVPPVALLRRNR